MLSADVLALTTTTLEASDDATVDSNNTGTNYGTDLFVEADEGNTRFYLKYNISSISGTVRNAYVELTRDSAGDDDVLTSIHRSPANWNEGNIDWTTKPTLAGEITGRYHKKSKKVRFDVTRFVQEKVNTSANNISMSVRMETAAKTSRFHSSEYSVTADRPTLVVETSSTAGETSWQCTRLMGFSQTSNWYLVTQAVSPNDDTFEESTDITSSEWAYARTHSCGVTEWWDPTETDCYATWTIAPADSDGCTHRESAPDRVVIHVSGNATDENAAFWEGHIKDTIDTAREQLAGGTSTTNYNPEKIYLIPVIGGPDDEDCRCPSDPTDEDCTVRAAENHPTIETASNNVAGSSGYEDVYYAGDFEVSDCGLFSDDKGHIREDNLGDQAEIRDTAIDLLKDID
jgi:hypothetical protein